MNIPLYVRKRYIFVFISLMPTLIIISLFVFYPIVQAFMLSLTSGIGINQRFIGFAKYKSIFRSSEFWNSLKVTGIFIGGVVSITITLALILAVILNNKRVKGRSFFRACLYFPHMTAMVIIALVWQNMLNTRYGIVNYLFNLVGLKGVPWLRSSSLALFSLMMIQIWAITGWIMMLILANLQGIPSSYYDAAEIDGANAWQRLIYITIPLLLPVIFLATLISTLNTFVGSFTLVQIITRGGPHHSTDVFSYLIYKTAFEYFDLAGANALALIAMGLLLIVGVFQIKSSR